MRVLDHALAYARRGWPVFPIRAGTKQPATRHGFKDAVTDEGQIRTWWPAGTGSGIGMATGDGAGVWVLDVDPDKGGQVSLQALQDVHGALPLTLCVATGGGGWHLYFRMPDLDIRNREGFEPGLDVRGNGGYVVAPPSLHPDGGTYAWVDESVPMADAPDWLVEIVLPERRKPAPRPTAQPAPVRPVGEVMAPRAYAKSALEREASEVRSAAEGGRNRRLNIAAFAMKRFVDGGWLQQSDVESELQLAAEACGLTAAEARKTIASGLGASSGRDLPAVREPAVVVPMTPALVAQPAMPQILATPAPRGVALAYIECEDTDEQGRLTLRRWRSGWWRWTGAAYREISEERLGADLWQWSDRLWVRGKDGPVPYEPSTAKIANLLAALKSHGTIVDDEAEPPVWVGDGGEMVSGPAVAPVENGLLDLASGVLCPSSPNLFVTSSIPVAWDDCAPEPVSWLRFLRDLWPTDSESIQLVQEWFGYCLTPDTSQQKMLMIVGPKRGGKGTISEVLRALLGAANITAATLSGITKDFGLQAFLSKLVAVFPDVRLSGRTDLAEVAERLLMISGEDAVPINRKFLAPITAKLPSRLVLLSNEVPKLVDSSGALASRFLLLQLNQSFYGREDRGLKARLLAELPAILRWAVEGWRRLQKRGRFVQPEGASSLQEDMRDLGSPIQTFVAEECRVDPDDPECKAGVNDLYAEWVRWCTGQGLRSTPRNVFSRDLSAAFPSVRRGKDRATGAQRRVFEGIATQVAWNGGCN